MFEVGELVDGRYEILGPLGVGGMAHVFRARDAHLERTVALKVLRPHLTEADSERFRREIRALARLNHPGIVNIFDLGLGEQVYFAMELIDGGPITDLGPYAPDPGAAAKLLGAAVTVAEALGYVHRLGMVHRDLTPRNILVAHDGTPKVMDFGLVQLTETSRALTRTGFTLGTPLYMAPEQATGEATGAATDIYAFGAVLYRTTTGSAAFDADNDQAVLYKHVYSEVTPPRELNPQVPQALEDLILAMLHKEPDYRPPSGGAVADALRAVLASELAKGTHAPLAGPGHTGSYGGGPAHPATLKRRWTTNVGEGPQYPSGLAAANGFLLAGLRSDALAVIRPADGGVHRLFELRDEASRPPLFTGDRLLLPSRDGSLRALSWPEGRLAWERPDEEVVGVCAHGQDAIVGTAASLAAWRVTDGSERWRTELTAECSASPTVHRGYALVPTVDGWLHALSAKDGAPAFKIETGTLVAPVSAKDGVALIPVRAAELHAFDLLERDVRWSYDLEGEQWTTPAIWREFVYAVSWGRKLHALSLKSGDDIWERDLGAPVTASPVVAAGAVYVATESGKLLAFDARSGRPLLEEKIANAAIQASPLPLDDGVVVAALDGTVVAFG